MADRYGSDKGPSVFHAHKYTFLYDLLFYSLKNKYIDLLEIGLARGGPEGGGPVDRTVESPSVRMWLEYFKKGRIFGFDISDFSHLKNKRFKFIRGDVGIESEVSKILDVQPCFDIIIDDASHASYHQQLAFKVLFGSMKDSGLYIIEDLHWQSPYYETVLPNVPKTAEMLDAYFLRDLYMPNAVLSESFLAQVRSCLVSYAAFPSFTGSYPFTKIIVMRVRKDWVVTSGGECHVHGLLAYEASNSESDIGAEPRTE